MLNKTKYTQSKTTGKHLVLAAMFSITPALAQADVKFAAKAFTDICLSAAPGFKSVPKRAKAFGAKSFFSLGALNIASVETKDISVQYEQNKECAITTSKSRNAPAVFLSAVQKKVKVKKIPAVIKFGNRRFLIAHDRKGGEAFVLIKK